MKKSPIKITLAILLLLLFPVAGFALGLGNIHVYSYINQPLNAVIPITGIDGVALGDIKVHMADRAAYENAGITYPEDIPALTLTPEKNKKGGQVIVVSTENVVTQPILTFMLELAWPQGIVFREYSILLNPPIVKTNDMMPKKHYVKQHVNYKVVHYKFESKVERVVPLKQVKVPTLQNHCYGPIKAGSDLYGIAMRTLPSNTVTPEQNMVAIFKKNPQAFTDDNINGLIQGACLALPTLKQVQAFSPEAALAIVHKQNIKWATEPKNIPSPVPVQSSPSQSKPFQSSNLPALKFNPSSIASLPAVPPVPVIAINKATANKNAQPLNLNQSSIPNIENLSMGKANANTTVSNAALALLALKQVEEQQKLLQMKLQDVLSVNKSLTTELGKRDKQLVNLETGKTATDAPLSILSSNSHPTLQPNVSAFSYGVSFSHLAQWINWVIFIVFLILIIAVLMLLLQLKKAQAVLISKEGTSRVSSPDSADDRHSSVLEIAEIIPASSRPKIEPTLFLDNSNRGSSDSDRFRD